MWWHGCHIIISTKWGPVIAYVFDLVVATSRICVWVSNPKTGFLCKCTATEQILFKFSSFIPWEGEMCWLVFGEILIILLGEFGAQKWKKLNKVFFSTLYVVWASKFNCLKIIENGKKYHNIKFWFNSNNEFGFRAQKVGFDVQVLQ